MCGIAGIWRWDGQPVEEDRLLRMAQAIAHRGPDGEGIWQEGGVGFVHRRLAIIDTSSRGAQPMISADERYVVTFNGEIYNYQELRRVCEERGSIFRSDSDTEVLLQLYARKGEKMLADLRGMFAFAIWDREARRLFVARDRLGKKPFFYRRTPRSFVFASEIHALLSDECSKIDLRAIRVFLGLQYVPAPLTGFQEIEVLQPGHAGVYESGQWRTWSYDNVFAIEPYKGTYSEAKTHVRELLEESIRLRLMADVPVGAFLSGGIDSSAIAVIARQKHQASLSTFTMGFSSLGFDERQEAAALAKRYSLPHFAFEAQAGQVVDVLDELVQLYGVPYADSSALPAWLLARETAKHVKVVLTGDGADELFAGYRRHVHFSRALVLARLGGGRLMPWIEYLGRYLHDPRFTRFMRTVKGLCVSPEAGYAALFAGAYFSREDELRMLQPGFKEETESYSAEAWIEAFLGKNEKMIVNDPMRVPLVFDRSSYLIDDLNVKMDRATMAHGLEARAPFLDQELVRFASSLPSEWLIRKKVGKYLLKDTLKEYLPPDVLGRKKRGFQVPLAAWFRGELRATFEERCLSDAAPLTGICRPEAMKYLLEQNDRGADHGNRLWMLLVLSTWLQKYARG